MTEVAAHRMARESPGASRALAWSFANTAVSRLGTLGIGIVLARLLGPEAFGTYAVAFVALAAVLSFNELGVSLAIVRWPGDPRQIAPTVTTVSTVASLLFFAGSWVAAEPFARAMGDPAAVPVVRLLLLSVVVNGVVATPAALLQREFRQGTRMIIDQVNVWSGAVVSIVLALVGFGAMSLAIGRIVGTTLSAGLFLVYSPLPYRFALSREHLRPLLSFGLPLAGVSVIVFAVGYIDQLVVGRLLGSTMLGFYVLAFTLSSWPVSMFSQPLRSVAPAAFARLQHVPDAMRATFLSLLRVLSAVAVPVCFFLAGAADPLVRFVYGERWAPAAAALSWLALVAAFRIVFELAYDYLVVVRRSRSLLLVQVAWLAGLVPALIAAAFIGGIAAVGAAQVVVVALVVTPIYLWRLARNGIRPLAIAAQVWLPLLAGFAVLAASRALALLVSSILLSTAAAGVVTLAAMAVLLYRDRSTVLSLRRLGEEFRPVPGAASRASERVADRSRSA